MLPKPAHTRRRRSPVRPAAAEVQARALALLRARVASHGFSLEPDEDTALRLFLPGGTSARLRLLAAAAPHRRGGRGSWGLHWMLTDDGEDYVALVDLSREAVWLMPTADFRDRAQPLPGGRFHLDWLVWRLSPRSQVEDEDAFEQYRLETVLRTYCVNDGRKCRN